MKNKIYTGTSGVVLPLPNKKSFPEELQSKSRLQIYSTLFNSVEINSSFYKIPMASTVQNWAAGVPESFRFTFKLWRDITHNKELAFNTGDVGRFMAAINTTGDKKGCLLIQLPPKLTVDATCQLGKLLSCLRNCVGGSDWKLAVEFRNRSWYQANTYQLLDSFNTGLVLQDMPSSAIMQPATAAAFVYLRLHGPSGGYRGSYSDDILYEYAGYMNDWADEDKTVYVYFNNTMGEAMKNLLALNAYLERYHQ